MITKLRGDLRFKLYPVGPLLRDVDPDGKLVPVELHHEGLQQAPHHVDHVHQSAHAPRVHVGEVVVGEEHSVHLCGDGVPVKLGEAADPGADMKVMYDDAQKESTILE